MLISLESLLFVGKVWICANFFQAILHRLGRDLLLVALALDHLGQRPFLAAVLLPHLIELLLKRGELGVQSLDGIASTTKKRATRIGAGTRSDLKRRLPFR